MSGAAGKWTGKAQAYAQTFALLCAEVVEPMLGTLAPTPGQRLLDIGTGTGAVAAAALARGCRVVAIDPEPDMVAMAAQAAPGAEVICTGLPELAGVSGDFDLITANCVVNHLAQPAGSLQRLADLLRPGGRLAVSTWPADDSLQRLWTDVVEQSDAHVPAAAIRSDDDPRRSLDGLAGLVESSGLRVERAWRQEFVHVVDPALWWSGPTSGVARIGQIYLAQMPQKAAAMASAYHRLSAAYLEPDGQLHLPAAALLVVARRPV